MTKFESVAGWRQNLRYRNAMTDRFSTADRITQCVLVRRRRFPAVGPSAQATSAAAVAACQTLDSRWLPLDHERDRRPQPDGIVTVQRDERSSPGQTQRDLEPKASGCAGDQGNLAT